MDAPCTVYISSLTCVLDAGLAVQGTTLERAHLPRVPAPPVWPEKQVAERGLVCQQIGEFELRLPTSVESRCQAQYGDGWITRVPAEMREAWNQLQAQDERAFAQYNVPTRSLLDYSYISELKDLGARKWALFPDVFGSGKNRKRMFDEHVQAMVRVRNPLAHNRIVPENELKRAEVYCTDLLLLLMANL